MRLRVFFALCLLQCVAGSLLVSAQQTDASRWMDYMREARPNYFKVKSAFEAYWKDSIPERGHGYKVFKRWEWRVQDFLDSMGYVHWPSGQINDLIQTASDMEVHAGPCPANGRLSTSASRQV